MPRKSIKQEIDKPIKIYNEADLKKSDSFSILSKDKNLILYTVNFYDADKTEDDIPEYSDVEYYYERYYWFYCPKIDTYYIFDTNKKFYEIESLLDLNEPKDRKVLPIMEYRDKVIIFPDASPRYEHFFIASLKEHLVATGFTDRMKITKNKKSKYGRYQLKFMEDADYAMFKLRYYDNFTD